MLCAPSSSIHLFTTSHLLPANSGNRGSSTGISLKPTGPYRLSYSACSARVAGVSVNSRGASRGSVVASHHPEPFLVGVEYPYCVAGYWWDHAEELVELMHDLLGVGLV